MYPTRKRFQKTIPEIKTNMDAQQLHLHDFKKEFIFTFLLSLQHGGGISRPVAATLSITSPRLSLIWFYQFLNQ